MPVPALITTIGGADSNSYVSLAEADAYFEARLDGESWATETSDRRTQGLLKVAKRLDQINWLGSRVTTIQALSWPRIGVAKRDGADVYTYAWVGYPGIGYGDQYRTDEIPDVIKDAQCEFAFAYLNEFNDGEEDEIESFGADGMNVKFRQSRSIGDLPAEVMRLVAGLIAPYRRMRG
jgi:hypothetical protein